MRRAGLQKVRLKERRDIGAAVTIAQRPTFGQKRRFDHASAASGLAQQPDILSVPRHVSKVPMIGIGGSLAAPPLPHHRTYGSVYGGSRSYANALRSRRGTRAI